MNDVLVKSAKRRRGQGVNPLYILVSLSAVLLSSGIWLLVAPAKLPDTNQAPQFPAWIQASGAKGRRAYAQTVAYQEELQYIPCYCGCGNMGHRAVVDCHITDVADDGTITYDRHSST